MSCVQSPSDPFWCFVKAIAWWPVKKKMDSYSFFPVCWLEKNKFGKLERSVSLKVFQPNSNSCARVHMNKTPGSNFQEASQRCCRSHIALLADVFLSSIPASALQYLLFKNTKKKVLSTSVQVFSTPTSFYRTVRLLPNTSCFILLATLAEILAIVSHPLCWHCPVGQMLSYPLPSLATMVLVKCVAAGRVKLSEVKLWLCITEAKLRATKGRLLPYW